jgi:hypothetical protein
VTHRARLLGGLLLSFVLLGFVFNIIAAKNKPTAKQQPQVAQTHAAERPMEPLYVPRPISLIYGRSLSAQSSAEQVAQAFVISYYSFDTSEQDAKEFFGGLPRVAPEGSKDLKEQLEQEWQAYGGQKVQSTVPDAESVEGETLSDTQAQTVVSISLTQRLTYKGKDKTDDVGRQLEVTLVGTPKGGWLVRALKVR